MNKILVISISIFLASCGNNDITLKDSVYADGITVENEEFVLSTKDSLFLKDYNILSSHACGDSLELIAAYNRKIHGLDIFAVQGDYSVQVAFNLNGENSIVRNIQGLHFHSLDSIWVYSQGLIYLTDTTGVVKKKIDIGRLQNKNEEIIIHANYSISRVNLYYHKERKSLFYATRVSQEYDPPYFYVYEYFLENGRVGKYDLSQSDYDSDIMLMYGWMNAPNITFSDTDIIYNYPIESNIYTIALHDGSKHVYGGKSKYTENSVLGMSGKPSINDTERHKIENVHFYELVYNPTHDLYFRLHVDRSDFYPNQNAFVQFNKKDLYLMIFNHKFEVVYEDKLPSNRYSIIESWCSVEKGLLMFVDNYFLNIPQEEETILFDVIKPQE